MKLTILGNNGPYPSAGGACSGYLLTDRDKKILLDCGNGTLANLLRFTGFESLDAVILTHLHSDHMSDMMVLRYAIQVKAGRGAAIKPLDVYAPSEPREEFERLDIKNIFNLKQVTEDLILNLGSLKLAFKEMRHPVKCFAVSVENGEKRFVYSGDTSWNKNIIEFSKDSDLLLLDAGLSSKDRLSDNVPHLTAKECGMVAKESGAKKLLLTHFWPEDDVACHLAEAKESFGNVETAKLLCTYDI